MTLKGFGVHLSAHLGDSYCPFVIADFHCRESSADARVHSIAPPPLR